MIECFKVIDDTGILTCIWHKNHLSGVHSKAYSLGPGLTDEHLVDREVDCEADECHDHP